MNMPEVFLRRLGASIFPDGSASVDNPRIIFDYAYAVFHSPTYRSRYAEFLKTDFPRLPLTSSLDLFRALAGLGGELVALHLMESPALDRHLTTYTGPAPPAVEKVSYARETVWLDKAQTRGLRGVPEDVWNFRLGGYQVCHKWLKDRKGRVLSPEDITHYHRIVVALHETIRLMGEIDAVIEQHGGWPGAFAGPHREQSRTHVGSSSWQTSTYPHRVAGETHPNGTVSLVRSMQCQRSAATPRTFERFSAA